MDLFVRIDDYTEATPEMCPVVEWLLGNGYRIHIAVIPGRLTRTGARFLEAILSAHPGQVEFGQHGYIHACRRFGRKRFEVGPGMSRSEQTTIIALGRQAMWERLATPAVPVFTPPFNGYDDNTILALIDNGFDVLSAAVRSRQQESLTAPLRQVSINVDVCDKYFPSAALRPVNKIGSVIRRAYGRDGYIGIMLHPNLTVLTDAWLTELFSLVSSIEGLRPVLLSQVNAPARTK
jgi:hypothetical protein